MCRRLSLALSVLAVSGCAGQGDDYIHATIDGKRIEFREDPYAIVSGLDRRMEVLTFAATVKGSDGTESFEVDLELPGGQLTASRYSSARLDDSQPRPGLSVNDELTAQYSRDTNGSYIDDPGEHGAGDFVLEVTSIGKHRVAGRFSGDLEREGTVIHVTGGAFSLAYEYKPRNIPW